MNEIIRKYENAQTSHTHDGFHQIILPLTGNLELEIEGTSGAVGGSTLGIITSGQKHAFHAKGANNFLVLDIDHSLNTENMENVWSRASDTPFQTMSQALINLGDYAAIYAHKKTQDHWFETWQKLFLTTLECDLKDDLPAFPKRLEKTIRYMQENLAQPVKNTELAEIACLSPARFYELFKQVTGLSPQAYLTKCRLQMSKRLILQGNSLAQIAGDVGFSDQSSFGRAFQKEFGQSPGNWREQESQTKLP